MHRVHGGTAKTIDYFAAHFLRKPGQKGHAPRHEHPLSVLGERAAQDDIFHFVPRQACVALEQRLDDLHRQVIGTHPDHLSLS